MKIDEIKLDENFIYGEDFSLDENVAYNNALEDLTLYANEIRSEKGKGELISSNLIPVIRELIYKKGERKITFLYAEISEIISLNSTSNADIPTEAKTVETYTFLPDKRENTNIPAERHEVVKQHISNDVIQTLCGQDNWPEIKGFLSSYKQSGKIREIGNCFSHKEVPEDAYSILIDEMYGILSILSPKTHTNRINYRTNKPDSENNYPNCKIIVWYR